MVDLKSERRRLKCLFALFLAGALVFPVCGAGARYKERPKRHFLSWESLRRPEDYRRLKDYTKSLRRFSLSRRRVVKLKKSSFWNLRPYQFSTPLVDGDRLYVGVDAGFFYAVRTSLPSKIWTFQTEGAVQGQAAADKGDVFITDCKGFVYDIDADSGKERWRSKLDTSIMATPLVVGDRLYVVTMSGRLYAIDRSSGVELWHTSSEERSFGFSVRRSAAPVRINGMILVGTSSGYLIAYRENDGSVAWLKQFGNMQDQLYDIDSKPLFIGDKLFVSTAGGALFCLDSGSGRAIWEIDAGGSNDLLYHEGKLYASGGNTLTSLDPDTGRIFWQQELNEPALSSPAGGDHYVAVAATTDKLYLVDSDTGDILFERYIRKGSFGDPVVAGELLYVLSNSGRMFAFKVKELKPKKSRLADRGDAR